MKLLSLVTAICLCAGAASAATLSAPGTRPNGTGNNGYAGIMFDINVAADDLTLTALSTDFGQGAGTFDLWVIEGGFAGNENASTNWTLASTLNFSGSPDLFNAWDIDDVSLSANTTYGLFINDRNYTSGLRYQNYGNANQSIASDANLTILAGNGKAPNFGRNFSPRGFVGSLEYEIVVPPAVPLPAGLPLMIAALGALAFAGRMAKRS